MATTAKTPKRKKASAVKLRRWSIGVFPSATNNHHLVTYCRVDGTVSPSYAETVKTKKALFHEVYAGVTYARARRQLLADAAKAGVNDPIKK